MNAHELYTKLPLRFRNGKYRILMISDFQEGLENDGRTLACIDRLIDHTSPDLVVLGGDICHGDRIKTADELEKYLTVFTSPMEKRGIPWCNVFGNHDHDVPLPDGDIQAVYESFPHCVSKHEDGITGETNFVLPVLSSDGSRIAYAVWGLDSNNLISDAGFPAGALRDGESEYDGFSETVRPINAARWDIVHFDQLMWYYNTSVELEKYAGHKVNGFLAVHIAPWEFQYLVDNPEITGTVGTKDETMSLGRFNSGLFAAVLQRGDIKCIGSGHSHEDSFDGVFCGIRCCMDACAGCNCYGLDEIRGGRVIDIDESDTSRVSTYMVAYKDIM